MAANATTAVVHSLGSLWSARGHFKSTIDEALRAVCSERGVDCTMQLMAPPTTKVSTKRKKKKMLMMTIASQLLHLIFFAMLNVVDCANFEFGGK